MPLPPGRILFQIGPIAIYWYSVLIVSGALAAAWLAAKQAQQAGENPEHAWDAFLLCLFLGVIGARLYHVASMFPYYWAHPGEIFTVQMHGFGIFGAVAGGALGLWIYTRWQKLSFLRWADFAAPGLALAQAIGRWGNYFNQELYGTPTDLPWKLPVRADTGEIIGYFHPTFLYESLWNLLVFAVLMVISRKATKRLLNGDLFLLYGVLYPLGRFFIEYQRPDAYELKTWVFAGVPMAQWVSIAAILFFGSVLIYRHQRSGAIAATEQDVTAE